MSRLGLVLTIAAAATLAGCAGGKFAGAPRTAVASASGPAKPGTAAKPANRSRSSFAASQAASEPPITDEEASAQCWMKYEHGRRDLDLDKRADLVDKCIDAKMHGRPVP